MSIAGVTGRVPVGAVLTIGTKGPSGAGRSQVPLGHERDPMDDERIGDKMEIEMEWIIAPVYEVAYHEAPPMVSSPRIGRPKRDRSKNRAQKLARRRNRAQ